ncbi:hypothetical protein [Mycobacterium marinum]|uniref:hypothetical protein n=1 Tax=Mycobacterium marinum TaxID=1781 RepID=UPI00056B232D|nr:hypothetical protein [Mycobacterium marinum]
MNASAAALSTCCTGSIARSTPSGHPLTPQRNFGPPALQGFGYLRAHSLIGGKGGGADGQAVADRSAAGQTRFQVHRGCPEDLQWPDIVTAGHQHSHLPAGHHPVAQPASSRLNYVDDAGGHDLDPIVQAVVVGTGSS